MVVAQPKIDAANAALSSGDSAIAGAIACGDAALPALTAILLHRGRGGKCESRCRAVTALAALGAKETLFDFLNLSRSTPGALRKDEEPVIDAAASALIGLAEIRAIRILDQIFRRRSVAGIVEALKTTDEPAFIPLLIKALKEDESRAAVVGALIRIGERARQPLTRALLLEHQKADDDGRSNLPSRRLIASVIAEVGIDPDDPSAIRSLIWDRDPVVAAHVCRGCLKGDGPRHEAAVMARLEGVIARLESPAREQAIDCLMRRVRQAPTF